jgi:protein-tyrosine phosphatase
VIDTHCHLLWRIDDGPKTQMASVDLARALVEQGVDVVLCTPHFSKQFPTRHSAAQARHEELGRTLEELGVQLRTELAAEVASKLALSVPIEDLSVRSTHGFVLVELESGAAAAAPALILERLNASGLTPIFAHPERSRAVRADPNVLDAVRGGGALVQVVSSSLSGRWGAGTSAAAWRMLDEGRVDLLASDAHAASGSVQQLRGVLERVLVHYGAGAVDALTVQTPARVLSLSRAVGN